MDYYNELKSYQISSHEQRKLYWRWYFLKCTESKTKLIMSFMPMALNICTNMAKNTSSIDVNDYFQESYLIIDEAINKYDHTRAELSTFVYHMIRWHLKDYSQKYLSPVKYSQKARNVLKRHNISMNTIYWSDIEIFYNNDNRSDTISPFYKKEEEP